MALYEHGDSDDSIRRAVRIWFWLTTYGGVFAGVNSAIYDRAASSLDEMRVWETDERVAEIGRLAMSRDLTLVVTEVTRFDFRAARAKACMLAMARFQDGGDHAGPAHRALAHGADALQLVFRKGRRSSWHHLTIVTWDGQLHDLREALRRRSEGTGEQGDPELLQSIGLDPGATGPIEELLEQRRQALLDQEKQFVARLGLTWEDRKD